jgi:hypothetical protein
MTSKPLLPSELAEELQRLPSFYDNNRKQYLGITLELRDRILTALNLPAPPEMVEALEAEMPNVHLMVSDGHYRAAAETLAAAILALSAPPSIGDDNKEIDRGG